MQQRARTFSKKISPLLLWVVVVPTALAAIYFGFIASDVYTSESRFIVKSPGKQVPSGLASLLVGGDAGGGTDVSTVREYATSRDALKTLNAKGRVGEIYNVEEADFFSRLNKFGQASFQQTFDYFLGRITIENVNKSSVTILRTQAFRPQDAQWLNEQLLRQSEDLVNRLNMRSRTDTIRYAEADVANARQRSTAAAAALAAFRNRYGVVDPDKQAAIVMQMISKLQDELIATKALVVQTRRVAPDNPQIAVYEARVGSLQKDIDTQSRALAGDTGSLSGKTAEYSRLMLESQFADRLLTTAMASLESANNEARRQQVYLERVSQPDLPDEATRPRRLRNIFAVLVLSFITYGIIYLLVAALKEHKL